MFVCLYFWSMQPVNYALKKNKGLNVYSLQIRTLHNQDASNSLSLSLLFQDTLLIRSFSLGLCSNLNCNRL